jgi:hypothetical protein
MPTMIANAITKSIKGLLKRLRVQFEDNGPRLSSSLVKIH